MPELPEVETTRAGLAPHVQGRKITKVTVRQRQLRWQISDQIFQLEGGHIQSLQRRGKYLILSTRNGCALIHLGMSGSLRLISASVPPEKHDHWDMVFDNKQLLRYRDPRRFGALLWTEAPAEEHKLLCDLGIEPLTAEFCGDYLFQLSRGRRRAIKSFIMDSKVLVGVGNIYASEALFQAGIHPQRRADRISLKRYELLVQAISEVLTRAISAGGTSLQDFFTPTGEPGYFSQQLTVYGRENQPCRRCGAVIKKSVQAQRSSYYCPTCQH